MSVVLGYSGLDGADQELRDRADLDAGERRLYQGMDAAAALAVDGRIVAAVQEERFSGLKGDGRFPLAAIRWCLHEAGVDASDLDQVAHGFNFGPYARMLGATPGGRRRYEAVQSPERQQELIRSALPGLPPDVSVRPVRHHAAHALSAAVASPFESCLVVVADGMGEVDAISVHRWHEGRLHGLAAMDWRSSLGLLYSLVTLHLGFQPNSDEYMVMGLASYGDGERYADVLERHLTLGPDGRVRVPLLLSEATDPYREQYRQGRARLEAETFPRVDAHHGFDQDHADLAASLQGALEKALRHVIGHWSRATGLTDLAFAGGVALNCVANQRILASGSIERLYVQPAAGDEGTAVGAAFAACLDEGVRPGMPDLPLLGPGVDVPGAGRGWRRLPPHRTPVVAAELVSRGAIVGWCQGRLELGPRALGNRSILADPRRAEVRDRVNAAVKLRQAFRPLAPAVLADGADEWFDLPAGADLRHMTVTVTVRPDRRDAIPAVTHVDGSARVQVVEPAHARFAAVLEAFRDLTSVPVLLNTSLNVKGQPIACTAGEAWATYERSGLDALFVGDHVVARPLWADDVVAVG